LERQARRTFDNTDRAPMDARRFVGEFLNAWPLTEMTAEILLAVNELTTNAVVHGSGPIDVAMDATSDRLRVTVTDHGGGTPAFHSPDPRDGETGGWGLYLVDKVADQWGTERRHGRTTIWFDHALPSD
jgi:anti-sigma regulatory factor (Ser/Thr protein kinase)